MHKKNDSIFLFIVEEDYKRNKAKQNDYKDISGKAEPKLTRQNHASVIIELEKMHPNFEGYQGLESVQTPKGPKKIGQQQVAESSNVVDDLGVLASFQKMIIEEQKLLEPEMDKKKMAINNLKSEIQVLENTCKDLSQALGIPTYN